MNVLKTHSNKLFIAALIGIFAAGVANADGPAPVDLGDAGGFAVLSQTGITNVYRSKIVGDVGTSPITGAALLLKCKEITGDVYTVDAAGPLPCSTTDTTFLTSATGDMGLAYDDAAGRVLPDFNDLGAGEIGGMTLEPGLYKWTSGLSISTDVTLDGGPDDVWIFQVAGTLNQAGNAEVILTGGALAKMLPLFKVGAGGVIGSGRQGVSWISLDDAIAALLHCLMSADLEGPVNLTTPHPVDNRELTKVLARVLRRPALARVPSLAARVAFGEMAEEMLLTGSRVVPNKLLGNGFEFRQPDLETALRHLLGRTDETV